MTGTYQRRGARSRISHDGQGGHRGADVPDRQQQDEDAHAQLRRQHDPARDQDARRAVAGVARLLASRTVSTSTSV